MVHYRQLRRRCKHWLLSLWCYKRLVWSISSHVYTVLHEESRVGCDFISRRIYIFDVPTGLVPKSKWSYAVHPRNRRIYVAIISTLEHVNSPALFKAYPESRLLEMVDGYDWQVLEENPAPHRSRTWIIPQWRTGCRGLCSPIRHFDLPIYRTWRSIRRKFWLICDWTL